MSAIKYAVKHKPSNRYYEQNSGKWNSDLSKAQLCDSKSGAKRSKNAAINSIQQKKRLSESIDATPPADLSGWPAWSEDLEDEIEIVPIELQEVEE